MKLGGGSYESKEEVCIDLPTNEQMLSDLNSKATLIQTNIESTGDISKEMFEARGDITVEAINEGEMISGLQINDYEVSSYGMKSGFTLMIDEENDRISLEVIGAVGATKPMLESGFKFKGMSQEEISSMIVQLSERFIRFSNLVNFRHN